LRLIDRLSHGVGLAGGALLLAFVAGGAGCGGDDATKPAAADVTPFIGDWLVSTGMAQATMCEGLGDPPPQTLNGTRVTVKAGTDAPLDLTVSGCVFKFDVQGSVATARPGQTCMTTLTLVGVQFKVTLTIDSSTFTVTGNDGALVQNGRAMATDPLMAMCKYAVTAMGSKTAATPDAGAAPDSGGTTDGATADGP
jgi:hypothetical protein